jgi:gamma-glutamylcysteine synthetase
MSQIEIQPKDPSRGHFYVSLAKSFLRIAGGVTLFLAGANPELMSSWLKVTAGFLMLAECLGILEELV